LRHNANATALVILPSKSAAQEAAARIQSVCPKSKPVKVHALFSVTDFERAASGSGTIAVTCPSALLALEPDFATSFFRHLSLAVFDDLHLLNEDYELAAARLLAIAKPNRARLVGLTSSLNDPTDLATWLGVEEVARFNFVPTDRGHPIITSVRPFSLPHSATLMKVMVKPTYDILKSCQAGAIVFVPSRAACRTVAADLVTQSGNAMDLSGFLKVPRADVEPLLQRVRDEELYEPLLHGIGYITANMAPSDMSLVLELFASGIVRALIAPREACWSLPVRSETVIVMAAQYIQMHDGERRVVNYSRTELVKMQSFAITSALPLNASSQGSRMYVLCQGEQKDTISRALNRGLPLESNLPALLSRQATQSTQGALDRMLKSRPPPPKPQLHRPRAADLRKRDMMDLLSWTYLALRVKSNPTYYDIYPGHEEEGVSRMIDEWFVGNEFGLPMGLDKLVPSGGSSGKVSSGGRTPEVGVEVVAEEKVGEADGETMDPVK
jgi:antiviral helicase SLH1